MVDRDFRWVLVDEGAPPGKAGLDLPFGVRLVAGRAPDAPIKLGDGDALASRYHAALEASTMGVQVVDLDSRNGVFVNKVRQRAALLVDGDKLRLGSTVMRIAKVLEETSVEEPFVLRVNEKLTREGERFGVTTDKALPLICEVCKNEGPVPAVDHEPWWREVAWICPACAEMRKTPRNVWPHQPPAMIGELELLRFMARGGMSAVFEARHVRGGMRVAVKIMVSDRTFDRISVKRFVKEQRIAKGLVHDRIVRCVDVGMTEQEQLFVATEHLMRGDAMALASDHSDPRAMVSIVADMLEALSHAHDQGFVHRDVKPTNALLCMREGRLRAKLGDFGLAKNFRDIGGSILTKDQEVAGSAAFLAPEQLLGFRDVGPSADLYSAGASLYHLLTGELPIALPCPARQATTAQLCLATLAEERVPIAQRRAGLHPWLQDWIDLLVCREPKKRAHVTAAQVADVFRKYLAT